MPDFETINPDERVRVLESRYSLMRDRLFLINQNMITEYKKLNKDIKFVNDELKELKQDMGDIKSLLRNIFTEMQGFAKKEEIKVIAKYLDLINPINFMTEEDVKKIIRGERHSKRITDRKN